MNKKKRRTIIAAFLVALLLIGVSIAVTIPKAKESTEKEQLKGTEHQTANENTQDRESGEDTRDNNPSSDKPAQPETDEDGNKPKNEEPANSEGLNDDSSNSPAPTNPEQPESSKPSTPEVSKPPAEPTPSPSPSPAPSPSTSPTPAPTPHSHSFGEWKTVKKPTCTEPGEQQRTCSCGKTEKRSIKAKDHKWETRTRDIMVEEWHYYCNCGYYYGNIGILSDEEFAAVLDRHQDYDENGNERPPGEFSKHAAYHDEPVMVKKGEEKYQVCTVCGEEK